MDTKTRIDQARWWTLTHEPFYGQLSSKLGDVITESVDTAATNGRVIKWSPDYVAALNDPKVRFVLLHETLHCGHLHPWRLPADELGNEAGDHAINLVLSELCRKYPGELEMPADVLCDAKYVGMAEEDILADLKSRQQPPQQDGDDNDDNDSDDDQDQDEDDEGDSSGSSAGDDDDQGDDSGDDDGDSDEQSGSGDDDADASESGQGGSGSGKGDSCGSFTEPEPDDPGTDPATAAAEAQELREDWASSVIQAAQAAQALGRGDIPADMLRELDRLRHQSIDWRGEMADFVKSTQATRPDWKRSGRRYATAPVIYPRRIADSVGKVVFVRDTSGSISNEIASEFTALITDCLQEVGCEGLVVDCDDAIHAEYEVTGYDECPAIAHGCGGTDFRPVFDRVEGMVAMGEQIAGVVYLTDLQGPAPESSDIPTLWLATPSPFKFYDPPKFGRVVEIES